MSCVNLFSDTGMKARVLLGLLCAMPLAAPAVAPQSKPKEYVPLPDCRSLPKGEVAYSPLGSIAEPARANTLSLDERKEGWRLLFDGVSLAGWSGFQQAAIPGAWRVENGTLFVKKWNRGNPTNDRGDLRTVDEFDAFELRLQWAATPASNSGIFFFAKEGVAEAIYEGAPELQILDDAGHEDGLEPSHRAGGLYDLWAPRCNALRPVGEYNDVRLIVRKDRVEHWLNGYQVLSYQLDTPEWRERIAHSKFRDMSQFGVARRGHIALQDHGDVIRFRNIRIHTGSVP